VSGLAGWHDGIEDDPMQNLMANCSTTAIGLHCTAMPGNRETGTWEAAEKKRLPVLCTFVRRTESGRVPIKGFHRICVSRLTRASGS